MNVERHAALEPGDPALDWSLFAFVRPERSADTVTIAGLVAGTAMLVAAIVAGGSMMAFVDAPSLLIVVGGLVAVLAVGHPGSDLIGAVRIVGAVLSGPSCDAARAASAVIQLADTARRHGALALEQAVDPSPDAPLLHRGIAMVIDGVAPADIEKMLYDEIQASVEGHDRAVAVIRHGAEAAPAMGLIGTLIGLVQMLGHLEDPSTIGPSMAVALLTTLYGAVLAHMALTPLASKVEKWSNGRTRLQVIYAVGALSIARQENPRRLEARLNSLLPAGKRVTLFD